MLVQVLIFKFLFIYVKQFTFLSHAISIPEMFTTKSNELLSDILQV